MVVRVAIALLAGSSTPVSAQAVAARLMFHVNTIGPTTIDSTVVRQVFTNAFAANAGVRVLSPITLDSAGAVTPQAARRLGRIEGAQYAVNVDVSGTSRSPAVSVRVIDIETSRMDREMARVSPGQTLESVLDSLGRRAAVRLVTLAKPK
jgi:hypothetical protein